MKRLTINLPDALYETLRAESYRKHVSLGSLIRSKLDPNRRSGKAKKYGGALDDVVGIGSDDGLTGNIDGALYGI